MSLKDVLNSPEPEDARRKRPVHPRGYEPGVRYAAGKPSEVTLTLKAIPDSNEEKYREEIKRVTGLDVPEDREVELEGVRFWGPQEDPYIYVRFKIVDRARETLAIDGVAILGELRAAKKPPKVLSRTGEDAFVIDLADWQIGLKEGGGTPAFLTRLDRAYTDAVRRVKELRSIGRDLGRLVVVGGGDLIENCAMRPNQAFELDLDRRGQVNVAVAGVLDCLDRLAPMFSNVTVVAVGGNHGEHRISGQRTTRADNDDVAIFEHAARAAERDSRLQHVDFVIAQEELSKTIEVAGWVLGVTHGQSYGKTHGGSIEAKVWKWVSGQAAGRRAIGDSDVLLTHHYHHVAVKDFGGVLWVQAPALDGGSAWFTESSGMHSEPGVLTFVMTPKSRFQDMQVL